MVLKLINLFNADTDIPIAKEHTNILTNCQRLSVYHNGAGKAKPQKPQNKARQLST